MKNMIILLNIIANGILNIWNDWQYITFLVVGLCSYYRSIYFKIIDHFIRYESYHMAHKVFSFDMANIICEIKKELEQEKKLDLSWATILPKTGMKFEKRFDMILTIVAC